MTAVDVSRIPKRRPGRPLPPLPAPGPAPEPVIPWAAPPWIDTDEDRAARCARLSREVAAYDADHAPRNQGAVWDAAIRDGLAELATETEPGADAA